MSDEFDRMMRAQFDAAAFDADDSISDHGVLPPDVDNHTALHLLEAEIQLTAFLYAEEFVGDFAADECPGLRRCLDIGLAPYMTEELVTLPELGSPRDIEWTSWVRVAAGQAALGLEKFLTVHELPQVTVMVHLSNHGWYPFTIRAGGTGVNIGE